MSMADPVLTPAQVHEQTGFAEKTLANWRSANQGPAYFKVGRLVRYRQSAVDAFLASFEPMSNVTHLHGRRTA